MEFAAVFLAYRLFFSLKPGARAFRSLVADSCRPTEDDCVERESCNVAATLSLYDSRRGVLRKHQQFRLRVTLSTRRLTHMPLAFFVVCSGSCINCGCILRRCPLAFYFYFFPSCNDTAMKAAGAHERKRHPVLLFTRFWVVICFMFSFRLNFDASTNNMSEIDR